MEGIERVDGEVVAEQKPEKKPRKKRAKMTGEMLEQARARMAHARAARAAKKVAE